MTKSQPVNGLVRVETPDAQVVAILTRHFELMRSQSPEESCHVLAPNDLFDDKTTVLAWREDDTVLGIGALKLMSESHGELKSMHTTAEARGRGIARSILLGLIAEAEALGLSRVSLETGSAKEFEPARRLYAREGFSECPPFGTYTEDPLSVFMTRCL